MEINYYPIFEPDDYAVEIEIRGRLLTSSNELEFTLISIIAFSAPDPHNQSRRFKKMRMNEKIQCAIADLKKNKPDFYQRYKQALDKLDEFRILRNYLAHLPLNFPEKRDLSYFDLRYVDGYTA